MVVSSAHFTEITNGYEKRSDGLWLHRGKADLGSARITNVLAPSSGAGLEMFYNPDPAARVATIQPYDRDAAALRDLNINARNLSLQAIGGTLTLPAGSIGTAALALNSVQQLLGQYTSTTAFSTTATSTWIPTSTVVSITTAGGLLRIEWAVTYQHAVLNGQWLLGLGWDAAVAFIVAYCTSPMAGVPVTASGVYYVALGAGTHTVQMFVDNLTTGALSQNPSVNSMLYVTEQKR